MAEWTHLSDGARALIAGMVASTEDLGGVELDEICANQEIWEEARMAFPVSLFEAGLKSGVITVQENC